MYIFLNEKLVPEPEACVSVYDHGFLYGDGVYETMRAYKGIVFMLSRHIERLKRSASAIALKIPGEDFIKDAVNRTLRANGLSEAYIRITLSRGKGPIGLDPDLCSKPTFVVIAENFKPYPGHYYEKGVKVVFARTRRNSKKAIDPGIKSLNFLNNILARIEAGEMGAQEAVMLNPDGFLCEGTVSNIFFVAGGVLCTPSKEAGILDGITRELVLNLAAKAGIGINEGMFYPDDIFTSSEIFYTNTTSEIMPVSRADEVEFPVGEVTRRLHGLYKEEIARYIGTTA
jgi:branched-chain amino acid aminotransferase